MVKTSGLQPDFGRVQHVHIPYILSKDEYVEKGTCVGFVRFQNFNKHDSIAKFLFNKKFAGPEIKRRNNFTTKATSLSKA